MYVIFRVNPEIYGVILGAHIISQPSGFEMTRGVSRLVIHPQYDSLAFNFDVALIEVGCNSHSVNAVA